MKTFTLLLISIFLCSCNNNGSFPKVISKDEAFNPKENQWENIYGIVSHNMYSRKGTDKYFKCKVPLKDHGNNIYEFCFYSPTEQGYELIDSAIKAYSLKKPMGVEVRQEGKGFIGIRVEEEKKYTTYYIFKGKLYEKTETKK